MRGNIFSQGIVMIKYAKHCFSSWIGSNTFSGNWITRTKMFLFFWNIQRCPFTEVEGSMKRLKIKSMDQKLAGEDQGSQNFDQWYTFCVGVGIQDQITRWLTTLSRTKNQIDIHLHWMVPKHWIFYWCQKWYRKMHLAIHLCGTATRTNLDFPTRPYSVPVT